jgi:tetratricopeptide (TPR) repeat protein
MSSRILSSLASSLALAVVLVTTSARADDEALKAQRERFKAGMVKYEAGAYAEAILVWEQVYREIGEVTGYKLAFNLGRAYDRYGDSTRAAERYEAFVRQVGQQQIVDPETEKWETEAKERLEQLAATKGRIKVAAGERPVAVRIDVSEARVPPFTAYVAPGHHTLTFDTQKVEVDVEKGAIVEISPPAPPPPMPAIVTEPPKREEPRWEARTERPFSPVWLYVAGGATALSTIIPIVTYSNAYAIRDDYESANDARAANATQLASDYDGASGTAYATLAIPIVLAAVTAGLAVWYFVGTKETRVNVGRF